MASYEDWYRIKQLESSADQIGMRVTSSRFGGRLALVPKTATNLPAFTSDVELCSGTVEELQTFLHGWERAHQYLISLRVTTVKKIQEAEKEILMARTVDTLKGDA